MEQYLRKPGFSLSGKSCSSIGRPFLAMSRAHSTTLFTPGTIPEALAAPVRQFLLESIIDLFRRPAAE
jgi:hypothetical protein